MKKTIFQLSALIISLIFINSCTDNDLKYIAKAPEEGSFKVSADKESVILTEAGAGSRTAITIQWDSLVYSVSTATVFTIQLDTMNGNFLTPIEEEIAVDKYEISFTDSILNKKLLNLLKLKPDVEQSIKVRVKANMAFGNMPVYSTVMTVKVTPYTVSKTLSFLYMPGNVIGWSNYSKKICSRNNDGIYEGFVTATIWENFQFSAQESYTGKVYGSDKTAGVYKLNDTAIKNNIWFDEAGYLLITANLNTMSWSKKAITSFCVTGDFNSWSLTANTMTYDETNKVWTANCNISTIGSGIQIIGNADWSFKYGVGDGGKDSGELILGGSNLKPTTTGSKTVTMDLSKPEKYTFSIQ